MKSGIDSDSTQFKLDMACHYLKEHKRQTQLVMSNSVEELTLIELEQRGCTAVRDFKKGVCTISSPVPFGKLVTKEEWKRERWLFLGGLGFVVLFWGGGVVAFWLGWNLNPRGLTGIFWLWAWLFLMRAPEVQKRNVVIGLILFCTGIAVKLLGW